VAPGGGAGGGGGGGGGGSGGAAGGGGIAGGAGGTGATGGGTTGGAGGTGEGGMMPVQTYTSCEAVKLANPAAGDGVYTIDPDGTGLEQSVDLFCDMVGGAWTLAANVFDSNSDDAPNVTEFVVSGWQQVGNGSWSNYATTVIRDSSGLGSAAVSLSFVAALNARAAQEHLRICFVGSNGLDTSCRSSKDASMTLVGYPGGNPKLSSYSSQPLVYTYGRLAGLPGTIDSYNLALMTNQGSCIPRTAGEEFEFGYASNGICESEPMQSGGGVWTGWGKGMYYIPANTADDELRGCPSGTCVPIPNPSPNTYGFRLYVGP
jgi:hypothetical protein